MYDEPAERRHGEHVAAGPVDEGPPGSPQVADASEDPPKWWQQYRKAVIVAGIGLLAFLTDLAAGRASDGHVDWLHAMIVLVSTLLSTGGVATFGNTYSRSTLEAKLAQARRR